MKIDWNIYTWNSPLLIEISRETSVYLDTKRNLRFCGMFLVCYFPECPIPLKLLGSPDLHRPKDPGWDIRMKSFCFGTSHPVWMCRFQAPSANCLVCFFALNTKIGDLGKWLNTCSDCSVWGMFAKKAVTNVYGLNAGFPSIYLVRLVHYDQLPHFQSGLNVRKHSKKLTVKGGCSFFFPGWKCHKLFFFRPSILPPSPKHSIPSRFPGLGNSRLSNPIRKPMATQKIWNFHPPFISFGGIFNDPIWWVHIWGWGMKLETGNPPSTWNRAALRYEKSPLVVRCMCPTWVFSSMEALGRCASRLGYSGFLGDFGWLFWFKIQKTTNMLCYI